MRPITKISLLLPVVLGLFTYPLCAQNSFLDPTFGTGGMLQVPLPEGFGCVNPDLYTGYDIVLDARGNLIVVGEVSANLGLPDVCGDSAFYVTRLLPDGSLDTTFGTNGATSEHANSFDFFLAVGVQSIGRIVATGPQGTLNGYPGLNTELIGYTEEGLVDASFGQQGHATFRLADRVGDTSAFQLPSDLLIDEQDRILIAGWVTGEAGDGQFFLARFLPDGAFDPDFGDEGIVLTDFAAGDDQPRALALMPDGKIVAGGYFATPTNNRGFALARYLPDGSLDPSFGNSGKITTSPGAIEVAEALVVQPDGKLVVAGNIDPASGLENAFALVRLLSDGRVDPTFGTNGVTVLDFTQGPYAGLDVKAGVRHLVQLPDGKFLAGGDALYKETEDTDLALMRFLPDGQPDTNFGTDALVLTNLPNSDGTAGTSRDFLHALALQPDGKVVALGNDFKVARYRTDTSTRREETPPPSTVAMLDAPFPNPSHSQTMLRFTLAHPESIMLSIYDVLGRRIAVPASGPHLVGVHTVVFDAARLPAGVYFIRLETAKHLLTRPLTRVH